MVETKIKSASILCVGNRWFPTAPGGAERYVYELVHQLAEKDDLVELCAADLPPSSPQYSLKLTNLASVQRSLPQRLWASQRQFAQRSLSTPDAINLHFALYSFPILSQLPKTVPITFTFHGPWALESEREGQSALITGFKHWIEQQVYQRCDRFIVLSKAFGTILHETYGIAWDKIHIIPGGVDSQRFQLTHSQTAARDALNFPRDRRILFTPRRLVQRMGLDQLLLAMAHVKSDCPDLWLAIAGKGPQRSALEQQVQALGLQDQVRFLGFLSDEQLPIAYQAADLTVVPSQSLEGFGLILLESLASGTPVLCTPVGGMPEVLQPFCPELITTGNDATAIAHRLREWFTGNAPLPNRVACREYAVQHYDWRQITPKIREVLLQPKP